MSILCHRLFAGQRRFEDACIGKLQNHPLVKKAFGLELLKDMPEDFPTISSEEVVCKLFSPPIVLQMCSTGRPLFERKISIIQGQLDETCV